MPFFKPIAAIGRKVQSTFTFLVDENEFIIGSYSLNANDLTNMVLRSIQPLQFNGTAEELERPRCRTLRISRVKKLTVGGSPVFLFAAGIVDIPEKHHFSHLMHFIVTEQKWDTGIDRCIQIYPARYRNDNKGI
ncbi:hypothetical protein [Puia dinghuensis]|uniref:Uncharacterized protein n=1 Tax=Puia dinghuensis TaxID=1792502 RepID=A0A8J2XS80_9BACT|nr:hypothetical protein [Puia dinghuensis]GGA92744.1 hypothetical protein GCM10011511_15180 [Puia dinghuensis]